MKKVYFVRHGETDWNKLGKIQGQTDNALNENGRNEAANAAAYLADEEFVICYSSPLIRAKETAEIILNGRKCEIVCCNLLKEISYGVDEGQALERIYKDETLPLHNFFTAPDCYMPPEGGESIPHLFKRCRDFLDFLNHYLLKGNKNTVEKILVTCHGAFMRGIISVITGLKEDAFWKGKEQKNCAVTIIRWDNGKWILEAEAVDTQEAHSGTAGVGYDEVMPIAQIGMLQGAD